MVMHICYVLVTLLFIVFGVGCYISFGEETDSVITLNLPTDNTADHAVTMFVRVILSVALFFTYPIQMFPVSEIVDSVFFSKGKKTLTIN